MVQGHLVCSVYGHAPLSLVGCTLCMHPHLPDGFFGRRDDPVAGDVAWLVPGPSIANTPPSHLVACTPCTSLT